MNYYLALGSNMGDKNANLHKAVSFLQTIGHITGISSVYQTSPVGMTEGTADFHNMALALETHLKPHDLLHRLKEYEATQGRELNPPHYLPRIIDIDILLAENTMISTDNLVIPHKEMTNRQFVMIPLNEIAAEVTHPILKKTIAQLTITLKTNETLTKLPPLSVMLSVML